MALALPLAAGARDVGSPQIVAHSGILCPFNATELSAVVGRKLQRVDLSGGNNPGGQCSFAAVSSSASAKITGPEVFLTLAAGGATDLRDLRLYYAKVRTKLQPPMLLATRPDIGPGAFTLNVSNAPVSTTNFLVGKGSIATLVVDLGGAPAGKRDEATAERILLLVRDRLQA